MGTLALAVALTAPLGLFGGYWWAKSNIEVSTLFDTAQLLKTEWGATTGCGYIGNVGISASVGIVCEVPMTPDPE
jgi:hypothetical protein